MSTRRQFLVSLAAAAAYAHGMSADSVKDRFRNGRMSPEDVKALATGGVERLMTELLPVAREFARPPLSNFHVGAVALGTSGALYLGANFEVAHNALNQAI